MPGLLELGLGASLITDRDVPTPGAVHASVGWFPEPMFGLDLRVSAGLREPWHGPVTGAAYFGPGLGDVLVSPRGVLAATAQFAPFPGEVEVGGDTLALRPFVLAGAGAVATVEHYSIRDPDSERFASTYQQVHPALVVGAGLRVGTPRWGARVQVDHVGWIEVVDAIDLHVVGRLAWSVAVVAWPFAR